MAEPAKPRARYEDLYSIPENATGQIIDGELIVSLRPSVRHSFAASTLGGELGPPFRMGRGGPGGWIVLDEVELVLGEDLLVPDLAGWCQERFPGAPKERHRSRLGV